MKLIKENFDLGRFFHVNVLISILLVFISCEPSIKDEHSVKIPCEYLLFNDEFEGNVLDSTKWSFRGLGERRDAINVKDAISLENGNLIIRVYSRMEGNVYKHYTSMISTCSSFDNVFGYYEARIEFNPISGSWGAFWLQSPLFGAGLSPEEAGVEIDIIERRAEDENGSNLSKQVSSALHWMEDGVLYSKSLLTDNIDIGVKYHLYAVERLKDKYIFYYDNQPLHVITSTEVPISLALQYIILSCEVQDNSWAGCIPENGFGSRNLSNSYMKVDYVRVYSKNPYKE